MTPHLTGLAVSDAPFASFKVPELVGEELGGAALAWLRDAACWSLRVEDFYEQHEVGLLDAHLPDPVVQLVSPEFLEGVRNAIRENLPTDGTLELVDVCAHRLTARQTIRIHNDHIGREESHRLLLQLNEGWSLAQGGLLMLFGDHTPESLADVILPTHRSGFAFRISEDSHHAVSTIASGERFTVVYTFRQNAR